MIGGLIIFVLSGFKGMVIWERKKGRDIGKGIVGVVFVLNKGVWFKGF